MSRDHTTAREFAVRWSTSSDGEIANLSGCYLRAADGLAKLQYAARELVAHWDAVHGFNPDTDGMWRGIEEMRELLKEPT